MPERLDDLSRSFARHLRAEGKAPPRTAVIYGQGVTFFGRWLVAQGREPTLEKLRRASVREWLAQLAERHELSTVRTRYKGLHRFCSWLVAEGEVETNPLAGFDPPVAQAKPVPVLADADLVRLVKACAGKDFRDRRDEAVIRLLLDCGVGVSELCGLKVGDIDLDREMALVTRGRATRAAGLLRCPHRPGAGPVPPGTRSSAPCPPRCVLPRPAGRPHPRPL